MRGDSFSAMNEEAPQHICIVLLTGLGDVIHGLPVANALRDRYPDAQITWVAEPMPAQILEGHSSIDNLVVYRRSEGLRGIRELNRSFRALPKVDITLNLNVFFKSIWPTLLSRGRRRVGFDRARAFDGVWLAASERLEPAPRAHTADMFLEFLTHLHVPVPDPEWRLRFSVRELADQSRFFERFAGNPVATIIPASAQYKKDWLAERWARVADVLAGEYGFRVLIAGGPGERERAIANEIVSHASTSIDLAMGDSVRRLAWIVGGSNLLVAPDTGPVHIARALGVPVVGIYGHTNPWRVGPWRAYQDLWVDKYTEPGAPPDASNRQPKWNIMPAITVDDVLDRISVAVDKYGVKARSPLKA
jgi:heptosyltransferase I